MASNPEVFPSPALLRATGPQWNPPEAASNDVPETGADMSRYLYAFRRRWLIAAVVALPLSVITTFAAWTLQPRLYTAASILRLAPTESTLIFETADNRSASPNAFEVYKRSQRQWMRSRFVLLRALRDGEALAKISALRDATDPADWLEANLNVTFPDDSEVMLVSLSAERPEGLHEVVNAVVQAYFDEIVFEERNHKMERLSSLQLASNKADTVLRSKRNDLRQLVERVGTGDSTALTLVQQNSLQQFAVVQQQFAKVRFELMQAQGEFELHEAAAGAPEADIPISDRELMLTLRTDTAAGKIKSDKQALLDRMELVKGRVKSDVAAAKTAEAAQKLQILDEKLEARKQLLRHEMVEHKRQQADAEGDVLKRKIALLTKQENQLQKKSHDLEAEAKHIGKSSIDVEMMRVEMAALQDVASRLAMEYERTKVEMQSDSKSGWARVTLKSEAQTARLVASKSRLAKSIGAGVVWLILPILFVVWLDVRKNRINSGAEVEQGLGLSVIGSVPLIPHRVMRRLDGPSAREQYWRALLAESVDSIAAVLLHGAQSASIRIVMVSSANAGEGKTTLAAHLATSLAGAGCRTALIDFDLRRPALHRVLGLSLQPGVIDLLREADKFESAVQATQIPNLMFISAGQWSASGLARLAAGDLKCLFDRLRAEFDFVVVDGSPILPVVDTRLIAQHVDAVVLSVLRDVSCTPPLRAACQLLELFNVPILGVVVTGSRGDVYHSRYAPGGDVKAI